MSQGSRGRRFAGLKDLIDHLNAVGARSLAAIGSKSQKVRLQEDEKTVTLQVGKSVFDGAPRNMRTELWMSSLQRKGIGVAASQKYEDMLLSPVGGEASDDIDKDLGRTFPTTKRFAAAEGQDALRRVLRAYAAFDPEVGYCQGMNFVAGLLLMYLPERHAFGGLVVLMQDRGLRKYYSTDMSLIQTHLWQLGRLMPPKLCAHLESIGVLPLLYGASWLMTCFSADFPASFSARVMDVIMADKMDQALLKAAVALLKRCEVRLLQMNDMEDALHLLKLELPAWEEPLLHDVLTEAFNKPWSSRQLQLLGSLEGAETVAEALERVQRANLATSMDSIVSAADEANSSMGGGSAPNSRAGTPHPAPAAGGVSGGGVAVVSSSSSSGGGGGGATAGVLPLFPPPPSPKRPSSTGVASGVVSPAVSRAGSRASSQCGAIQQHTGIAEGLPAAQGAPGVWQQHAANGSSSTASHFGHSPLGVLVPAQQQEQPLQQQQDVQQDMIDMSSPRAGSIAAAGMHSDQAAAAAAAGSVGLPPHQQHHWPPDWDPFGPANPGSAALPAQQQHQQASSSHVLGHQQHPQQQQQMQIDPLQVVQLQQPLQQQQLPAWPQEILQNPDDSSGQQAVLGQLQELSLGHTQPPAAVQKGGKQHKQQPSLTEDDWGDFSSVHAAL